MTRAQMMKRDMALLNAILPKPIKETYYFESMKDAEEALKKLGYKYFIAGKAYKEINDLGREDKEIKITKTKDGYKFTMWL